ncbi:MAG: SH3 domain-containing protein, partial [Pseudomonadota bacterium]
DAVAQPPSASQPVQVAACVINVDSWDTLNVRSGPGTKFRILFAIPPDACGVDVDWNDCRGRWCRVWYGGRSGWAHTRYIG